MWLSRFCGGERRDFVRTGAGVGVNEVESWSVLAIELGEADLGRMALVLESMSRVLELDEPFARVDPERVTRDPFLRDPDTEGFGDIF